ncbi:MULTISPECIES: hypothetical protein [unclassified Polaribacter]|uniref:hypothetical protein n=1 Tax=unclassified Polaribacter TaxID=196858 RepID=UPI0011BE7612|nr:MULTISPECIES: hypothetical protein [unclassified Polaribacter]TXD51867.1 hypothetical protein ES043_10270 [Polaribacter sp. IC063]TXD59416.1 hypothetical protein ES044_10335 [Polaribacter sp. IC066]
MIKDFLHKLNEDYSNIDEVYSQFLKKYNPDNITKTEITFISIIQYDEIENDIIRNYLRKKQLKAKMYNIDYYNHYLLYGRFFLKGTSIKKIQFNKNEFQNIIIDLNEYVLQYEYIFNKLDSNKKIEFKQDTIDHLKNVFHNQIHSKYKIIFEDSIKRIENDFSTKHNKPQQIETNKPDEVKKKLHNDVFKDNAFEVWQSMFDKFDITKRQRTDIDFMFSVMKKQGLIHENIGNTNMQDWINRVYEISFEKVKFTNPKANSNAKRMIIFNDILAK